LVHEDGVVVVVVVVEYIELGQKAVVVVLVVGENESSDRIAMNLFMVSLQFTKTGRETSRVRYVLARITSQLWFVIFYFFQ
jgi:hypothetical protein